MNITIETIKGKEQEIDFTKVQLLEVKETGVQVLCLGPSSEPHLFTGVTLDNLFPTADYSKSYTKKAFKISTKKVTIEN